MADVGFQAIQLQQTACEAILVSPQCSSGFTSDCVALYCKGSVLGACNPTCCASSDPATCLSSGSSVDANQQGCSTVHNFVSICASYTSDFLSLPATQQVSCLCYSYSDFRPDILDGAADRCYSYLETQIPTTAASFSNALVDFCTNNGPAANADVSTTTSSSSQISISSTSATTTATSTRSSVAPVTSASTSASAVTPSATSGAVKKPSPGNAVQILILVFSLLLNVLSISNC